MLRSSILLSLNTLFVESASLYWSFVICILCCPSVVTPNAIEYTGHHSTPRQTENLRVILAHAQSLVNAPTLLPSFFVSTPTRVAWGGSLTAHVERPQPYRGRSVSKRDHPGHPSHPLRPRVARASETSTHLVSLFTPVYIYRGVARLSFTARIGRAQFHRARSASKKDGLAIPRYPLTTSSA